MERELIIKKEEKIREQTFKKNVQINETKTQIKSR